MNEPLLGGPVDYSDPEFRSKLQRIRTVQALAQSTQAASDALDAFGYAAKPFDFTIEDLKPDPKFGEILDEIRKNNLNRLLEVSYSGMTSMSEIAIKFTE